MPSTPPFTILVRVPIASIDRAALNEVLEAFGQGLCEGREDLAIAIQFTCRVHDPAAAIPIVQRCFVGLPDVVITALDAAGNELARQFA